MHLASVRLIAGLLELLGQDSQPTIELFCSQECDLDVLVLWYYETVVLCYCGTVVLWYCDTVVQLVASFLTRSQQIVAVYCIFNHCTQTGHNNMGIFLLTL